MKPFLRQSERAFAGVHARCGCGNVFAVAASLRGGHASCPACGKAAPVEGGPEPLFWALLGLAGLAGLGVALYRFATAGLAAGLIALLIAAITIVIAVLAS